LTQETGISFYWVDGNHEDHHAMKSLVPNADGFCPVTYQYSDDPDDVRLFYIPRGHTWEWDGVKFMGLGGAYSVDKMYREIGRDYFLEETITDRDVARAIANGPADVLLTHDTPGLSTKLADLLWAHGRGYKIDPDAEHNRAQLNKVVAGVGPRYLFHGHYHIDYTEILGDLTIRGLGCDDMGGGSYTIIDTEDLKGN
jgi:hypothetical protein